MAAIVDGTLGPGSRINIGSFGQQLGVSPGAVREALAMLETEGFVTSELARGYRVRPVSRVDLQQLLEARIEIERLCIAAAIAHGDLKWEGRIVSAFHQMKRTADAHGKVHSAEMSAIHAGFHRALLDACPNVWLLRMQEMLYRQSERYRYFARASHRSRDVMGEHQALMTAVLNHDVQLAQNLIAQHLQTTAQLALDSPALQVNLAQEPPAKGSSPAMTGARPASADPA